jgi:NADH-dependant formate dehydrogenase delta subunit FdsD
MHRWHGCRKVRNRAKTVYALDCVCPRWELALGGRSPPASRSSFAIGGAYGVIGPQIADHIAKFWDPRTRRNIAAHIERGGAGVSPLARAAIAKLKPSSR